MKSNTSDVKEKLKAALWEAELRDDRNSKNYDDMPEIKFSKDFEAKVDEFEKMAGKVERKHKKKVVWKVIGTVAAAILLMFVFANKTVQANLRALVEFAYKDRIVRTEMDYDVKYDYDAPKVLEEKYVPGWVPEGYTLDKMTWYEREGATMCGVTYRNDEGEKISFGQKTVYVKTTKETEGAIVTQVDINGNEGRLYTNLGLNGLYWTDGRYAYSIDYDNLTDEEVIEIAESIILYEE